MNRGGLPDPSSPPDRPGPWIQKEETKKAKRKTLANETLTETTEAGKKNKNFCQLFFCEIVKAMSCYQRLVIM